MHADIVVSQWLVLIFRHIITVVLFIWLPETLLVRCLSVNVSEVKI